MSIGEDDIKQLHVELEKYEQIVGNTPRVRFQNDGQMSIVEFLGCFECHMTRTDEEDQLSTLRLQLPAAISESKKIKLGTLSSQNNDSSRDLSPI